jgi:predicted GNAT family acetyltransferase
MIELAIVPFDVSKATEIEWSMFHIYRKLRHNETQPNLPMVANASYEETIKITPQRIKILRFNVFLKEEMKEQIGEVYFSYYIDGTEKNTAVVNTSVLTAHRHKGIGIQLLGKIVELAKEYKKTKIIFQSTEEEGMTVIEHIHAKKISEQEQFRLAMNEINWKYIDDLIEQTKQLNSKVKMEWVPVVNSVPDEILENYRRIMATAFDEHPKWNVDSYGGSKMIPIESLKKDIAQFNSKGGKWILGLIREKNGDISGLTELKWSPSRPEILMQFITHIKLKYRGSGKGKFLKAHTMKYIKENYPEIKFIRTGFVGKKDSALFKLNEQIGFKLFYHSASYEISTNDLDNWVNEHFKLH